MGNSVEYLKVFMEYESDDMPMVYFYEVDLNDERLALRDMEVFVDGTVMIYDEPYRDVIEVCSIPTVDELNAKIWGEGFCAKIISKEEFDEIWDTRVYKGRLKAT